MEQVFFKNIQSVIINELQQATQSIQLAVCWFTNKAIFDVLAQKASENISISMILLDDYANKRKEGLPLNDLIGLGVKIYFSDKTAPIHHKFCIIDKATLLSGSYDWTYFSESKALENIFLIKEKQDIIDAFVGEFEMLTSVLSTVDVVTPYSMSEGLIGDSFGLKNYLSEDVYLQALKADENGEDLHALNLMHHSAQIDEYKAEAQDNFIKEKQVDESESSLDEEYQIDGEEEKQEEAVTPAYTSRGIGLGFVIPTPTPEEESVEQESAKEQENVDVTVANQGEDHANSENNTSIAEQPQEPIETLEQPMEESLIEATAENQPVVEAPVETTPTPPTYTPNPEVESAIQQGEVAYQQGRLDEAVQFFTQAIMMQADNAKAYLNLAIVKWRQNRFGEQAEFATQSIQYDSTNAKAFNTLALAQDKMGNWIDAIGNYSKALELSPDNYSYLWNRAVAFKKIGKRQEAVIDFGKVVKLCNQLLMSNPTNQNLKMTMEAAMKEMGS